MNLKILSWNVRGLNDQGKRLCIKNLIQDWKANIICLQETKLEIITDNRVRSL
jgi:exonuclease III